MRRLLLTVPALVLGSLACGSNRDAVPEASSSCAESKLVGQACVGVPAEPTGDTSACSSVVTVTAASDLPSVLAGKQPGECILLAAGRYASVALPEGVSVFGERTEAVTVDAISVASGTSVIADLTVQSGTLTVKAGADARLSGVRIVDSDTDGLLIESGASVTVKRSEIVGAGRYGISAFDASSVELDGSIVSDIEGPGVWISCTAGCGCSTSVTSSITNSVIRNNRIVGLSVVGASVTIDNVIVSDTTVGSSFEAGGGVSISACSAVDANDLTVSRNVDFGMLVDDSTLTLNQATIDDNLRGMWVQAIGATRSTDSVSVVNAVIRGNQGVGFGVDRNAINVSIERSQITDTRLSALPVLVNGVSASVLDVGDGLAWLGASQLSITDVSLSNNARIGLLIDGPVASGSSIANLATMAASGTLDVLQQNLPAGGEQPLTSGTTPAIDSDSAERLAIPDQIAIPPSI